MPPREGLELPSPKYFAEPGMGQSGGIGPASQSLSVLESLAQKLRSALESGLVTVLLRQGGTFSLSAVGAVSEQANAAAQAGGMTAAECNSPPSWQIVLWPRKSQSRASSKLPASP